MKKSLIALAALATVGAAQAQSSNATIYGVIDAGVYSVSNANSAKTDFSAFGDSSIVSSAWGIRGREDLGGGRAAIFQLEGDLLPNNGTTHSSGMFRRASNVGLTDAKLGTLELGLKVNPIIATNAALMPVAGNTVSTNVSTGMGYNDFFTRNAITYTTPTIMGVTAVIQHGLDNTVAAGGSVTAGSIAIVQGPFTVRAAYQERSRSTGGANPSGANTQAFGKESAVVGASYRNGPFTVAAAYLSSKPTAANQTANGATLTAGQKYDGMQYGLGYQANAKVLLGATVTDVEGSKMTNAQARYALSKRTTAYVQYNVADNGSRVLFAPVASNTSTTVPVVDGLVPATNVKTSAVGFGVIHSF